MLWKIEKFIYALHCYTHFTAMDWNQIHSISRVGLYLRSSIKHSNLSALCKQQQQQGWQVPGRGAAPESEQH